MTDDNGKLQAVSELRVHVVIPFDWLFVEDPEAPDDLPADERMSAGLLK